jgi:acetyl esterase
MKLWLVKMAACILALAAVILIAGYVAFQVSPWPSALYLRRVMSGDGLARSLERNVPAGVTARTDLHYLADNANAYLDVFYPSEIDKTDKTLPTVVWIHGGAWLSGSKEQISGYLKILASKGYTTVGIEFSLAPRTNYPVQISEVNAALGYINENAANLHVDRTRLFLAGDSSGAQMAAQVATIITSSSYAEWLGVKPSIERSQVRGILLFCGLYDFEVMPIAGGIRSSLWSYIGYKSFTGGPELLQMSVARHVTAEFPPMFISVGNSDWLEPQSRLFADAARKQGVPVEQLFFSEDYRPRVTHEFQFYLEGEAGQKALERSLSFLRDHSQ